MAIAAPCNCRLILFEGDYLQCIQWSENWKSQIFFKRMNPHTNSDMQGHRFSMQIFSGPVLPTLRFFVWLWMSSCGRPKIFQRSCLWKNEDIVDDDNDTNFALSDHLATLETPFPFITPNDFELSTWCCTTTGKGWIGNDDFSMQRTNLDVVCHSWRFYSFNRNFIWYLARG